MLLKSECFGQTNPSSVKDVYTVAAEATVLQKSKVENFWDSSSS